MSRGTPQGVWSSPGEPSTQENFQKGDGMKKMDCLLNRIVAFLMCEQQGRTRADKEMDKL